MLEASSSTNTDFSWGQKRCGNFITYLLEIKIIDENKFVWSAYLHIQSYETECFSYDKTSSAWIIFETPVKAAGLHSILSNILVSYSNECIK